MTLTTGTVVTMTAPTDPAVIKAIAAARRKQADRLVVLLADAEKRASMARYEAQTGVDGLTVLAGLLEVRQMVEDAVTLATDLVKAGGATWAQVDEVVGVGDRSNARKWHVQRVAELAARTAPRKRR